MNSVTLVGRLTRDPEIRKAGSGTSVCTFNLAVNRVFHKQGEPEADFPTCVCFGKVAENLAQYQHKGSLIAVAGTLQTGSYEKDGHKVYTTKVVCNQVDYLEKKSDSAPQGGYGGYGQNQGYNQQPYQNQGYGYQQQPSQYNQPPQGNPYNQPPQNQGYQNPPQNPYGGYQNPPQNNQALDQAFGNGISRDDLPF